LADVTDLAEYFRAGMFEDSVYVLTPQGRVIDLPAGSTPVDFAYHVHSELGHRCRGARVDGEMVSLNHPLSNGQTVEIVAAKTGGPSRDWLNPELGFIRSQRARAKVRQWFNSQKPRGRYRAWASDGGKGFAARGYDGAQPRGPCRQDGPRQAG
jgi:GTP pyrophosphokinase